MPFIPTLKQPGCGCERGYFLCPEAVRLWKNVNTFYELLQCKKATEQQYKDARQDYERHFIEHANALLPEDRDRPRS